VISGERDADNEVENDVDSTKWYEAGVYDGETGLFYLRQGEYSPV